MADEHENRLEAAIDLLACKFNQQVKAEDALKYSQAALNLAQVKTLMDDLPAGRRKPSK